MNITLNSNSMIIQRFGGGLKSTEEKAKRQQEAQSQIDFLENQKAGLKDMECCTLDRIQNKLELLNNYEAQISAVKMQYNAEEIFHCLEEAKELGEKIAKAVEEREPKTAEERKLEKIKEARGIEDEGGLLEELLEDALLKELEEESELTVEVNEESAARAAAGNGVSLQLGGAEIPVEAYSDTDVISEGAEVDCQV